MEEKGLEVKVGLLIFVAAGILVAFILILGDFSTQSTYEFNVEFRFSGDIQSGAPVKISGEKVGKVKKVEFIPEGGALTTKKGEKTFVRLTIAVQDRAKQLVRKDSEFSVTTQGILGEKYLEVTPGKTGDVIAAGEKVLGRDPPRVDLLLQRTYEMIDSMSELLKGDTTDLKDLVQTMGKLGKTVNQILNENKQLLNQLLVSAVKAIDKVADAIDEARPGIEDAKRVLAAVRNGIGDGSGIRRLVGNAADMAQAGKELVVDAKRILPGTIAKAEKALDRVDAIGANVQDFLNKEKGKISRSLTNVEEISVRAKKMTADVEKNVAKIFRGKGSIAKFLNDDEIYDNVREMMRDLKRHPWKILWKD
ncbi:MAG: MCE family protein [Deltaproteobacteria bacterium]|nr:MCE family protein [Deltaproteobacteria bacterium]